MSASHPSTVSSGECPSLDTLRDFAQSQLSREEHDLVQSHLAVCSRCSGLLLALPETGAFVIDSLRAPPADGPDGLTEAAQPGGTSPDHLTPASGQTRGLRLGRYVIHRQLGKGGFGTVYAAHDEDLDRLVAVKVPYAHRLTSAVDLQSYHAEARLHASLDHPNIVPIYDVGRTREVPFYLVSKLIAGTNLAERLDAHRPDFRDSAALLVLIALALEHMHSRGLVHRDVKPRNILVDASGTPYLADFGLAIRPVAPEDDVPGRGVIVGTPAYMSPEQARGEGDRVDGRTDVYSLGVVMYELLTGVRPFAGGATELRRQILNDEPPPPRSLAPDVPRDLEAICRMALAKDPNRRYQQAADLAEDLRRYLSGEPPLFARRVGLGERAVSWLRRHAALAALGGIALVALGLAVWAAGRTPSEKTSDPPLPATVAVTVDTQPPGAAISYVPLDARTGVPLPDQATPGKAGAVVRLSPGQYLVVAVLEGEDGGRRFHEVFRQVPGEAGPLGMAGPYRHRKWKTIDGTVQLEMITIPPADVTAGMCLFPGAKAFVVGSAELKAGSFPLAPPHRRRVPAFYLDTTEVTEEAYHLWLHGDKANQEPPPERPRHAVTVMWDLAVAYAEKMGKRLPDEAEYEYAATAGGTRRFPWGDADAPLLGMKWPLGPVGEPAYDRLELPGQPPVLGLYSNVAEWTTSWEGAYPGLQRADLEVMARVVRGAPQSVVLGQTQLREPPRGPRERFSFVLTATRKGLGFRCARSKRPRLIPGDFTTILGR